MMSNWVMAIEGHPPLSPGELSQSSEGSSGSERAGAAPSEVYQGPQTAAEMAAESGEIVASEAWKSLENAAGKEKMFPALRVLKTTFEAVALSIEAIRVEKEARRIIASFKESQSVYWEGKWVRGEGKHLDEEGPGDLRELEDRRAKLLERRREAAAESWGALCAFTEELVSGGVRKVLQQEPLKSIAEEVSEWVPGEATMEKVIAVTASSLEGWVDHPFFHKAEQTLRLLWYNHRIDLPSQDIYEILGQEGLYSGTHGRLVGEFPVGVEPDFSQAVRVGKLTLPFMQVECSSVSPEAEWVSHDRRKRERLAAGAVEFIADNIEDLGDSEGRGIVLDVAGGNGELAHLIAQAEQLPEGVVVVVREYNPGMIEEGRKKIAALGLSERVVFLEGDAQESFSTQREQLGELLPGYEDVPVVAAATTYTSGALPDAEVARNISRQMYEDLAPGGLLINCDFAALPEEDSGRKGEWSQQTGETGRVFEETRSWLGEPLQNIYDNWGHNVAYIEEACQALEGAGVIVENEWEAPPYTLAPLVRIRGKVWCIPVPGYVQRTLRAYKPASH